MVNVFSDKLFMVKESRFAPTKKAVEKSAVYSLYLESYTCKYSLYLDAVPTASAPRPRGEIVSPYLFSVYLEF